MPTQDRQLRHSGFTLIELLAASFLAALLTLAVLRIVGTLARTQANPPPLLATPIVNILRHDFASARAINLASGTLTLAGYYDSPSRTQITYTITNIANHPWLIRRQSQPDAINQNEREELIAPDVASFSAISASPTTRPTDMPDRLRVTISLINPKTPAIDTVIFR